MITNYALQRPQAKIRLDLTLNPIGCPPIQGAMNIQELTKYPEPAELPELVQQIAGRSKITPSQVMLTAGADQAIEIVLAHILQPGARLGILVPTFPRFELVAKLCKADIIHFRTLDVLPNCTAAVLCTPNNPTTSELHFLELMRIVQAHPHITFVIDGVFEEFGSAELSGLLAFQNVILIKSLSKTFGLPGLRVGWIASHQDRITAFREGVSPFRIPLLSQRIALQALQNTIHIQNTITFLTTEFARIQQQLGKRAVRMSNVPFFLFMTDNPKRVKMQLLKQGISVLDSTAFPGAQQGFLRIAIGTSAQNAALLRALRRIEHGNLFG